MKCTFNRNDLATMKDIDLITAEGQLKSIQVEQTTGIKLIRIPGTNTAQLRKGKTIIATCEEEKTGERK